MEGIIAVFGVQVRQIRLPLGTIDGRFDFFFVGEKFFAA
jgi:hypothetical protein